MFTSRLRRARRYDEERVPPQRGRHPDLSSLWEGPLVPTRRERFMSVLPRHRTRDDSHYCVQEGHSVKVVTGASLTCPRCGHAQDTEMPTDACQFFYECVQCGSVLRPKPGDCCVFCSYSDTRCPSKQIE
jgi:hypothetical protein